MITAPETEAELAASIAQAAASRAPLAIQGLGSKSGFLRPVQAAATLSTEKMSGIPLHAPRELVITARAGTRLDEIEEALAAEGQHMIAEPPSYGFLGNPEQTIGGIVAANLSGPRRIAWGAVRDHVLGIRAVTGRGEAIHSGGRVLKNVTGLDLCKLFTGSYGTLGVITEVTLKVLPRPEATGTLVLRGLEAAQGVAALSAALGSPYSVTGAAYLPAEAAAAVGMAGTAALIRIEDFADSVSYRTRKLASELSACGNADILDTEASLRLWRAVRDAEPLVAQPGEAIWRVSVPPSSGPALLNFALRSDMRGFLDWGGGLAFLAGKASEANHLALTQAVRRAGGAWWLLRAPDSLRAAVEVVPPEPGALAAIRRRLIEAFDPARILNPGRMFAT
ncbi:MAG TPA: glycolate oxidase subunit GlcE [Acetobacteraceae bacterium]|nr:glycolate oxidase subunit GlcE [Acetobacteraceae bacterium]